jgi:hypothetical protein
MLRFMKKKRSQFCDQGPIGSGCQQQLVIFFKNWFGVYQEMESHALPNSSRRKATLWGRELSIRVTNQADSEASQALDSSSSQSFEKLGYMENRKTQALSPLVNDQENGSR